jgi:exodeoxyribonuclease VII large subunit
MLLSLFAEEVSRSDLMSFDNYNLAYYITQFPIPIISGIGHEKDTSIVDLVSHTSLKTPTAVAEFLIDELYEFDQNLDGLIIKYLQLCCR